MVDKRIALIFLDRDEQTEEVTSSVVLTCSFLLPPRPDDLARSISFHHHQREKIGISVLVVGNSTHFLERLKKSVFEKVSLGGQLGANKKRVQALLT